MQELFNSIMYDFMLRKAYFLGIGYSASRGKIATSFILCFLNFAWFLSFFMFSAKQIDNHT